MKRIALLIVTLVLLLGTDRVLAASSTPSATPAGNAKQIEDLKDRLATKVAELKKLERRAVFGTVKSISISTITIETPTKDLKIELPDEVAVIQYLKAVRTKLATADIEKGDGVVVFGDFDATVDILKASVIIIQNTATRRMGGTVTAVDKTQYTVSVAGIDGQAYTIDIETTTKMFAWDQTKGIQKGGFSKIVAGDTVQILGTDVAKKENRISAIRILDIGNLSGTPPAGTSTPTSAASPTPSTTAKPTATPTPTSATTPAK